VLRFAAFVLRATGKIARLLSTDNDKGEDNALLHAYFDRQQNGVNHREERKTLQVTQVQVWSKESIPRRSVMAVAIYSLLLIAGLKNLEVGRSAFREMAPLAPLWRANYRVLMAPCAPSWPLWPDDSEHLCR